MALAGPLSAPQPVWRLDLGHQVALGAWLRFLDDGRLLLVEDSGHMTCFTLGPDAIGRPSSAARLALPVGACIAAAAPLRGVELVVAVNHLPPSDLLRRTPWSAEVVLTDAQVGGSPPALAKLPFGVTCLDVSPDRTLVCVAGGLVPDGNLGQGTAHVVRLADGAPVTSFSPPERVNRVAFSPDGGHIVAGVGGMFPIKLGEAIVGRGLHTWKLDGSVGPEHTEATLGAVSALAWVGTRVVVGTSTQFIRVLDGGELLAAPGPLPDESLLGRDDGREVIFADTGKPAAHGQGVTDLFVAGETLWSTSSSGWPPLEPDKPQAIPWGEVRRWSLGTREPLPLLRELLGDTRAARSEERTPATAAITVSDDGRLLAIIRAGRPLVEVWDTHSLDP